MIDNPHPPVVSLRRYALLRGWGRWLSLYIDDISGVVTEIEKARGTNWAIAVADDYHALRWQRIKYQRRRAGYAVGMFGLVSKSTLTDEGWKRASAEEIAQDSRDSLAKVRGLATRALRLLRQADLLPCPDCEGYGYFSDGGDGTYPCERCQVQGVVPLSAIRPKSRTESVAI